MLNEGPCRLADRGRGPLKDLLEFHTVMNVPVLNKGHYIYSTKINVHQHELDLISKHRWHKLKGRPWNKNLGYIYSIVYELRKHDNEILYIDEKLIPIYYKYICVAYAEVDPIYYSDIMRHTWSINKEGYAYFFNPILKCNILMHRYIMDFPENLIVDHIHWNRLDNRTNQLRICTRSENSQNLSHKRKLL